jgi:hypothetical protein
MRTGVRAGSRKEQFLLDLIAATFAYNDVSPQQVLR